MLPNDQPPITLLFTHYGEDWIRGSERCLLDLITHLDRSRFRPVVWCNSECMANEVRRLQVTVYCSEFPLLLGWNKPRFSIVSFFKLIAAGIRLVDRENVRLIHANSGGPTQWLNVVARVRHLPLLTHLHSRYPLRDRITLGLHQVAMAVGVSQPVVDQLLGDKMPSARTRVISNGIDVERFDRQHPLDIRNLLELQHPCFMMATVGSLIPRKGTDLLVEMMAILINKGVPAQLAVIGDGPENLRLRRQIQRLGLQKQIHLLGERVDVVSLLRGGVDLFVSATREEVFGLGLAEAGLAQLPVVAPAVGGIPGVVVNGLTGRLVPAENVEALAQAVHHLYLRPTVRKRMGESARLHTLKHFTIQRNVLQFEQLYQRMLADPAMKMNWYSHWQLGRSLWRATHQLLNLGLHHFHRTGKL